MREKSIFWYFATLSNTPPMKFRSMKIRNGIQRNKVILERKLFFGNHEQKIVSEGCLKMAPNVQCGSIKILDYGI